MSNVYDQFSSSISSSSSSSTSSSSSSNSVSSISSSNLASSSNLTSSPSLSNSPSSQSTSSSSDVPRKSSIISISALLNPTSNEIKTSPIQNKSFDSYGNYDNYDDSPKGCQDSSISAPNSPNSKNSSSLPSTRRSSASDQASINNMITPPQTPGMISPTNANFQFPQNTVDQPSQPSMPPKVKRKRITQEQLADLVSMFDQTDTPSYDVREKLAKKLNMTNREVQVWFQNRRAKANRAKANEHNASHQHHRFLHHHSVSTSQAASGHASSIGMMNHGTFTFVPMFTNGGPSSSGPTKGRSNRRHSYVHPPSSNLNSQKKSSQNNNNPYTRPRASTVTGVPMSSHSNSTQKMFLNPCSLPPPVIAPIKDILGTPADLYQSGSNNMTAKSAIDILATAAEFVQSEEKEKERLKAIEAMNVPESENDGQRSAVWRPWLV
ncbi:580_t:CDS:2 [Diversispora eburnea]|uniref:580_t:CDS:1 n=1 Tax=Diversispora eburnea TaxID=1213867 RepID=A0A9N8W3H5_9GLOM|nr:580_t:CDS:2 [Diversispora eburnea]